MTSGVREDCPKSRRFQIGDSLVGTPKDSVLVADSTDSGDHFPDHGHQNHVSFSYPLFGTYPARLASKRLQIVRDRFKQDLGETLGDGGAHLLKCVGI